MQWTLIEYLTLLIVISAVISQAIKTYLHFWYIKPTPWQQSSYRLDAIV
jgi:hypothetical protein